MTKLVLPLAALTLLGVLAGVRPARALAAPGGTTYIVAPDGDDGGNGSPARPWKTLQRAARQVRPGDTVVVRPGEYAGFALGWDEPQGGTRARPITFRAEPGAVITRRCAKAPDGIYLGKSSYVVIQGFKITNAAGSIYRAGISSVQNRGVVLRDNNIDGCGRWGIFTSHSEDVRIENNVTSRSRKEHGIYVSNSADRPVVRGNTTWGNRLCGIHLNGDVHQGGDGIISGAVIENNLVYDNGKRGGSGINADGVQDSVFRNNLLYNNDASGISLYRDDGGGPSKNNVVVNNTVVVSPRGRWALNIQGGSTGTTVYNNILLSLKRTSGAIRIAPDCLAGFTSDYNAVTGRFTEDSLPQFTLAAWQARRRQDRHSFVATPEQLFADPRARNYRLAAGSPAIDTGTSLQAPPTDRLGRPRPQGKACDLGAHEASAAEVLVRRPKPPQAPTREATTVASPDRARESVELPRTSVKKSVVKRSAPRNPFGIAIAPAPTRPPHREKDVVLPVVLLLFSTALIIVGLVASRYLRRVV